MDTTVTIDAAAPGALAPLSGSGNRQRDRIRYDTLEFVHIETSVEIAAPAATVWEVLTAVETWPRWTESVSSLELLDPGPLRVGSRARIRQPRLRPALWTVTDLTPGTAFTWTSRAPGILLTAVHELVPRSESVTTARFVLDQTGPLAGVLGAVTGSLSRRYASMEARGLEGRAEQVAGGH